MVERKQLLRTRAGLKKSDRRVPHLHYMKLLHFGMMDVGHHNLSHVDQEPKFTFVNVTGKKIVEAEAVFSWTEGSFELKDSPKPVAHQNIIV